MFYVVPYRVLFHDTMAYGTQHFLTNFKFQCEAREHLLFGEILDRCTPEELRTFDDITFLTQDAFSRNLNGVPPGARVAILLSLEDPGHSSVRFCFRVVGQRGQPIACGFQTIATLSTRTKQLVAGPAALRRFGHILRERLSAPSFEKRVLAADMASIFSDHVLHTAATALQSQNDGNSRLFPSSRWESDDASTPLDRLEGKVFLLPGTGSLAWRRLAGILCNADAERILADADRITQSHLGYDIRALAGIRSEDDFNRILNGCPGIDQVGNYLAGVLCAKLIEQRGEKPDAVMGHSAGELSALAVGGAYSLADGLDVICKRISALAPHRGRGGMLALAADARRVEALIAALAPSRLQISVVNHRDQLVVSGTSEELTRLRELAAHLRIGNILLPSEYPFHSKLLEPAVERFERALGDTISLRPAIPVYSPLEREFHGAARLADIVPFHLVRPLDYREALERMHELGIRKFIDCSTGATLKGIVDRVLAPGTNVIVKSAFDEDLLGGPAPAPRPSKAPHEHARTSKSAANEKPRPGGNLPIAIVGLGCVLPGAQNPDDLWDNVENRVDSIVDLADIAPLEAADFLSRGKIVPDKTYSLLSGLVDGASYFSDQVSADGPSLAERILSSAVKQAAAPALASNPARVQLVIGSNADGYLELDEALLVAGIIEIAAEPADAAGRSVLGEALETAFVRGPQTALANNPGAILKRVAENVLDPDVKTIAVDAACASSLYAIQIGMELLRANKADVAICGGVFTPGPANGCLFSQFGGLSATGSRPLDASADGVVFSPGAAVIALKRLTDALRDDDRIEAVIRGCGTSSDGQGASIIEPRKKGQVLAMQRAYAAAQVDPKTVSYVEAHATATRVGDAVELAALKEVFRGHEGSVALGSIKANVGHTGWAAGAASVIKVCRALEHSTIPPQANFSAASPELELAGSPFSIPSAVLPWPRGTTPRRAGVNGFGFGGTNGHLVMEEFDPSYHAAWKDAARPAPTAHAGDVVIVGMGLVRPAGGAARFDDRSLKLPQRRRLLPDVLECMDRSQVLAIMAADQAIAWLGARLPQWRNEIGIILGFEGKTANALSATQRIYLDRIRRVLPAALAKRGASGAQHSRTIDELVRIVRARTRPSGPYTFSGLMPNLITGRVANLFDLQGPNFVVDAAGASLMEALRIATAKVQRGEADIMLAGGVSANATAVARLMTCEGWHRGRPLAEAAIVLAIARADFAREAGLELLATLSLDEAGGSGNDVLRVGGGPTYLMGAEGADEIAGALSKVRDRATATTVRWQMPGGGSAALTFAPHRQPEALVERRPVSPEAAKVDYCSILFEPAPAAPAARTDDLHDARVLLVCDQQQALNLAKSPSWICVCPSSARLEGARAVDPSSEAKLAQSFDAAEVNDVDAVIAVMDLAAIPVEAAVIGNNGAHASLDVLVALARLLYPRIREGRTRLLSLCCGAWGERALHPWTGLFGGTVKSLLRELPGSRCKAVHTDEPIGKAALEQMCHEACRSGPDEPGEIAYRRGMRLVPKLVRVAPRWDDNGGGFPLDENAVVLATGGGRGVTAKLVEAILERRRCAVVVLGRVVPDDLPAVLRDADEPAMEGYEKRFYQAGVRENLAGGIKALKERFQYLRACWEVQSNLSRFRRLGSRVEYLQADVTNPDAVERAISAMKAKFGRLDLIIHGAGIQRSRTLDLKTLAEYRDVVSTKVDGLLHLRRACSRHFPGSRIRYHLVTSAFSVIGNDGQSDYGAANETLNRMAAWHGANGEPWSALAWLGWAHVGMTRGPEYRPLAQQRGLRALSPEEGKRLFADYLAGKGFDAVTVLMSAGESKYYNAPVEDARASAGTVAANGKSKVRPNGGWNGSGRWEISPRTLACLAQHRVAGRPTVPGALLIDMAVRSALAQGTSFRSVAVKDASFERFIALRGDQPVEIRVGTRLIRAGAGESEYRVELRSDFVHKTGLMLNPDMLHYACRVHLAEASHDIDAGRPHLRESSKGISIPDPYLDGTSPVYLGGPFRCLDDIRVGEEARSASFCGVEGEPLPELSGSSIPWILLDALCRLSMLEVDADGRLPVCVPRRCSSIVVASGVNDGSIRNMRVNLRACALRVDGEMMLNSYAEASTPDGGIILALHGLAARRMGAVTWTRASGREGNNQPHP